MCPQGCLMLVLLVGVNISNWQGCLMLLLLVVLM
jgi:hypothetical protein